MNDAQVVDFNDRNYWSLSQLSSAFGPARETIAKRLALAGVKPTKKRAGHDVYHIAQAATAILAGELPSFESIEDPDKLQPKERLDWFRSQNERNKFLRESGDLVPTQECSQELAYVVKLCVRTLQTLPDILEMKCRLSPDIIQLVEAECDSAQQQLANKLAE